MANLKLIRSNQYLIELDLKNTLYLNSFFDEDDFVENNKVTDKSIKIINIDDEDDDEIDGAWGSVESSEKSESSENSESLDFEAMTDEELIAYYGAERIELGGYAPYRLADYIYDYYVRNSTLVVNGKLFYKLDIWSDDKNINTSMPTLIIDFEIEFNTKNVNLGRIEILNTTVKANMNNHISRTKSLATIIDDFVFIPFTSYAVLPRNVKFIDTTKKNAFNFNGLQYADYELKPKPQTFSW